MSGLSERVKWQVQKSELQSQVVFLQAQAEDRVKWQAEKSELRSQVVSLQAQVVKAKWQMEKNELRSHVLLLQMQVQEFTMSRDDHEVVSLNPDKMPLYGEEEEEEEEEDKEKDEEKETEDGEMEEVPGEVEEVECAGSQSEGSFTGDWCQRYDVNWGCQDHSAQDPYTNRGRTAEVSPVLEKYGFSKDEVKTTNWTVDTFEYLTVCPHHKRIETKFCWC